MRYCTWIAIYNALHVYNINNSGLNIKASMVHNMCHSKKTPTYDNWSTPVSRSPRNNPEMRLETVMSNGEVRASHTRARAHTFTHIHTHNDNSLNESGHDI